MDGLKHQQDCDVLWFLYLYSKYCIAFTGLHYIIQGYIIELYPLMFEYSLIIYKLQTPSFFSLFYSFVDCLKSR